MSGRWRLSDLPKEVQTELLNRLELTRSGRELLDIQDVLAAVDKAADGEVQGKTSQLPGD